VIIGADIPVALDFRCRAEDIFHGPFHCSVAQADEVYSRSEQDMLLRFAALIGMDLGELDVVRDNESGLIYVLDANRTSFRPALLTRSGLRACYRAMVPAFGRLIAQRSG
jgi:hypothetical protein